jgi:hypothetical protein
MISSKVDEVVRGAGFLFTVVLMIVSAEAISPPVTIARFSFSFAL